MVLLIGGESGLSQSNMVGMNTEDELAAIYLSGRAE